MDIKGEQDANEDSKNRPLLARPLLDRHNGVIKIPPRVAGHPQDIIILVKPVAISPLLLFFLPSIYYTTLLQIVSGDIMRIIIYHFRPFHLQFNTMIKFMELIYHVLHIIYRGNSENLRRRTFSSVGKWRNNRFYTLHVHYHDQLGALN